MDELCDYSANDAQADEELEFMLARVRASLPKANDFI